MYGFSDHLNDMPRTRLSALRHGSSRYCGCMLVILEHTFVLPPPWLYSPYLEDELPPSTAARESRA